MATANGNGALAAPPLTSFISNGVPPHDGPVDAPLPFDVSLFRSYIAPGVFGRPPLPFLKWIQGESVQARSRRRVSDSGCAFAFTPRGSGTSDTFDLLLEPSHRMLSVSYGELIVLHGPYNIVNRFIALHRLSTVGVVFHFCR